MQSAKCFEFCLEYAAARPRQRKRSAYPPSPPFLRHGFQNFRRYLFSGLLLFKEKSRFSTLIVQPTSSQLLRQIGVHASFSLDFDGAFGPLHIRARRDFLLGGFLLYRIPEIVRWFGILVIGVTSGEWVSSSTPRRRRPGATRNSP